MKRWLTTFFAIALAGLIFGCKTEQFTDPVLGPSYQPQNVSLKPGAWAAGIRRVAVLPLAYSDTQSTGVAGRDALEIILHTELTKAQRFECFFVAPADLKKWTNREKWSASDLLPGDMIQVLKSETGCDAILFPELTVYRPYAPLVIGWNLKLVSVGSQDILWSVDEIFDSSDKSVANGARRFELKRESAHPVLAESRQILISPRRFGQYTIETLVDTLPAYRQPVSAETEKQRAPGTPGIKPKSKKDSANGS